MFFLVFLATAMGVAFSAPSEELPILGIIGGERANQQLFKYQVSLELLGKHRCGGTLVRRDIVISAAHCTLFLQPSFLKVRLGSAVREAGGVVYDVENIISHPDFNMEDAHSDVAIIKLTKKVKLGKRIGSMSLARKQPKANSTALVSGWGLTKEGGDAGDMASELLFANVHIFSKVYCEQHLANFGKHMICAGQREGGIDACQADSGGPLVYRGKLVGIVSWGEGCGRKGLPGVYTNVAEMRTWILANIQIILSKGSS